jgi:transcriptional regulator with XRE-family HTH domain
MINETPADDPLRGLIAQRLKLERESRGMSIATLADVSGVSRAMISKVERAEASPTADLLGRLSGAFGLTLSTLLARAEKDGTNGRINRLSDQALWTDPATGYQRRSLSPPGVDPELVQIDLPPGASVSYPASAYSFLGGHIVWMLTGQLVIREGLEENTLDAGDCLSFDLQPARACSYTNPSATQPARYIVALARH